LYSYPTTLPINQSYGSYSQLQGLALTYIPENIPERF